MAPCQNRVLACVTHVGIGKRCLNGIATCTEFVGTETIVGPGGILDEIGNGIIVGLCIRRPGSGWNAVNSTDKPVSMVSRLVTCLPDWTT